MAAGRRAGRRNSVTITHFPVPIPRSLVLDTPANHSGIQPMSTASSTPAVTHHYAELGEVMLHYVTAGSGPPVVLLHGWARPI